MNTQPLTLLMMVAGLIFSGLVVAHPCDRDPNPDHRHCNTDPSDPDPVVTPEYTAALTAGGFIFGPEDVSPNNRDTGYDSTVSFGMVRPNPNDDGDDADAWDSVFGKCDGLLGGAVIPGVTVGADWGISLGGKKNSDTSRNIRITFRTVIADDFPEVELWISLFNWSEFPRSDFLPERGATSVYPLDTFKIYGDAIGGGTPCDPGEFTLWPETRLEICHKWEDGTGCEYE